MNISLTKANTHRESHFFEYLVCPLFHDISKTKLGKSPPFPRNDGLPTCPWLWFNRRAKKVWQPASVTPALSISSCQEHYSSQAKLSETTIAWQLLILHPNFLLPFLSRQKIVVSNYASSLCLPSAINGCTCSSSVRLPHLYKPQICKKWLINIWSEYWALAFWFSIIFRDPLISYCFTAGEMFNAFQFTCQVVVNDKGIADLYQVANLRSWSKEFITYL